MLFSFFIIASKKNVSVVVAYIQLQLISITQTKIETKPIQTLSPTHTNNILLLFIECLLTILKCEKVQTRRNLFNKIHSIVYMAS